MFSLLLALIYVSFISLGLPDSLLGSAWPQMQESLGVSLSLGGVISFLITASTILSSLMSHRVIPAVRYRRRHHVQCCHDRPCPSGLLPFR